jgi:hypothetical protein
MAVNATQRNATRNQSTLDITRKSIFTYGNRYREATFTNNTGGVLVIDSGSLVLRHATLADTIIPAIAGATLANTIGILYVTGGPISLADGATAYVNYCISGDVDGGLLSLPAATTLDTIVGTTGKALKDILMDLGIVPNVVTEIAKTDN